MQIQWYGQSFFRITAKTEAGEISIIMDPAGDDLGLKIPRINGDIVTISHDHGDHNNLDAVRGEPFVITTPGEFETKGVFVYGIPSYHDNKKGSEYGLNTIYIVNVEDLNVVHLGDLGHTLSNEQLERLSNVDILLIPVGGTYTIDPTIATEVMSQIEPRIVIPMHYDLPGHKDSMASVDAFVKASGLVPERLEKFKISKKDLPTDDTKLIILQP
ncbi:MAG: MBL fold metallo-hydrolase [Candidatus Buchananbacteria bacterium]|nr:MBL fold metallo-hydrolase [Candidatus Buchananbacteria bacterium]